ncbi:MAG: toprim domain-containing protein, partial [Phormidesmis sp. CAN_BIN44]|nr:toprim domain-containing protein [Phormidesmis sp. CAN_BIN44]
GYYDRFRDRLMIPILDLQGRVIAFGGRTLSDEQPKYLNSPETELFDKGNTLYGLDKARSTIAKTDQAVVVEGYFDVIALHASKITNAVASLGTALSIGQVRQLLRYTESKRIIFNFDADRAGVQAAERAIGGELASLAYQDMVKLRVLNLPDGKDPDDFLKTHSAASYQDLLDDAPLWIDWQIQQSIAGKDLKQADQFQQVVVEMVTLLGNVLNPTTRNHYIEYCCELLSQGNTRLLKQIEESLRLQVRGQRWHGRSQKWQTPGERTLLEQSEADLLKVYLHSESHRSTIRSVLEDQDLEFSLSHHRFLWRQIVNSESTESDQNTPDLLAYLRDLCTDFPQEMSQVYSLFELNEKTKLDILRADLVIRSAAAALEEILCEKRRRHFADLWKTTDFVTNPELAHHYQQKMQSEVKRIQELRHQREVNFVDLAKVPIVGELS